MPKTKPATARPMLVGVTADEVAEAVEFVTVIRHRQWTPAECRGLEAEVQLVADLVRLTAEMAELCGFHSPPPGGGERGLLARDRAGMARAAGIALRGLAGQFPDQARVTPQPGRERTWGDALRWLADRQDRLDYANRVPVEDDHGRLIPPEALYPFLTAGRADEDTALETPTAVTAR